MRAQEIMILIDSMPINSTALKRCSNKQITNYNITSLFSALQSLMTDHLLILRKI